METNTFENSTKAGFVSVVGRPNAGKSTLLNWLVGEKLAMVSHKANATRKRMNIIVMHDEAQIIFVDTPGIHKQEKLLNKFMMQEVLKAIGDCDFLLFLAPVTDSLIHYEEFLENLHDVKHSVLLSKIDTVSNDEILKKIDAYSKYSDRFHSLIPVSSKKNLGKNEILKTVAENMPFSPYLFDPDDLTTVNLKEIYKELIREALFQNVSDEIPYESDVIVEKVEESPELEKIFAKIVLNKESQKGIVIGKGGATIKRIGTAARIEIEKLVNKKVFLKLSANVIKGWSKDESKLSKFGYKFGQD